MDPRELTVVILCGGRGTRLQERTQSIPKPLVEIGGRPIVWHVIQIYAAQGFRRFLLCTGYKGELVARVRARRALAGRRRRRVPRHRARHADGRARARRARGTWATQPFCATYADGVADIDLARAARGATARTATSRR